MTEDYGQTPSPGIPPMPPPGPGSRSHAEPEGRPPAIPPVPVPTAQYPAVGPSGPPPVPAVPPRPPSPPRKSRKALVIWLVAAAVALLLVAGGIVFASLSVSAGLAPDKQVSAYLSALIDGDPEHALRLSGGDAEGASAALLSNEAYAASTNHLDGFTMGPTRISGGTALVSAEIHQGGTSYREDFTLEKAGKELLFFDRWKLEPVELGSVTVSVDGPDEALTVDGRPLDPGDAQGAPLTLDAFPGDYEVAIAGSNDYFSAEPATASVVGMSPVNAGSAATAAIETTLTDKGTASAQAAMDAFVDGCAAQPVLKPTGGCSYEAIGTPGKTYTDIVWTVTVRPTFTFGSWTGDGWSVSTATTGQFDATADVVEDATGLTGTATASIPNVSYAGWITSIGPDGVAVFEPYDAGF
jgi:hypothetical protein